MAIRFEFYARVKRTISNWRAQRKVRRSVHGCSGRIDYMRVLVPDKHSGLYNNILHYAS